MTSPNPAGAAPPDRGAVLVTGASTGIGEATAAHLIRKVPEI